MRLSGADAPVYVEPGASVAGERGDVLGELGAVGLGGPVAPGDARARERLLPAAASSLAARAARLRASASRSLVAPSHGQGALETQVTCPPSAAPERFEGGAAVRARPRLRLVEESPAARACSRVMSPARSIGRPFLIF